MGEMYAAYSQNISKWQGRTVFAAWTLQSQNALHFLEGKKYSHAANDYYQASAITIYYMIVKDCKCIM